MSDHLPECIYAPPNVDPDKGIEWGGLPCICDRLRACEQRVRQETFDADWSEIGQLAAVRLFRKQAYVAGLDAAREAVASLEPLLDRHKSEGGYDCCGCATIDYLLTDALAAIDALRGSGNPNTSPSAEKGEKP